MATTAPSLTPTLPEPRDIYSSLSLLLALLHRLLCALDPPLHPPSSSSSLVSSQIIHA